MLIEFKFRNFLSYRDEARFLMTRVKSFKEHMGTNVIETAKGIDLLKSGAIYGSNGGGKSNFVKAMVFMKDVVHNSFSDSLKQIDERPARNSQFKLNTATENSNSFFEVSFLVGEVVYRYGFEINGFEITSEWLYRKLEREVLLFRREGIEFEINKESFSEGEKYKTEINSNVLVISHLAQHNQEVSKEVFGWFRNCNVISGLHEKQYEKVTPRLLQSEPRFKTWLSKALGFLEITNVDLGEQEGKIVTYHSRYDANNLLVDSIPFQLDHMESEGTKKLAYFLGPIYDTLRSGKVLFVDEFDTKLHPNLSRRLLELFHQHNSRGAQLIFTAQDVSLMDKDLLRRDQIWFANKDQFGASTLYSLSEFNSETVRNTSDYQKKYLAHDFGAADTMELEDEAMTLLYGA